MNIGNSAFTFAGQPTVGSLTAGVETKSLSGWARAWASGADVGTSSGDKIHSPFEQSEWMLACARLVTNPLCSVPLKWWDSPDAMERTPLAGDSRRAAFWDAPGADDFGRVDYDNTTFALAAWLALQGEAYIVLTDEWLGARLGRNLPPFIVAGRSEMQPHWASRRTSLSRELLGYHFSASGVSALLIPDQVIRIAVANPGNRDRGLGAERASSIAANADLAAGIFARNVAASNGAQGDYIMTDGGMPSPEQREQIEAALREKKRRTQAGDFAPTFLAAGLKVQSPADRAIGAAMLSQRVSNRHSIAAAWGVPLAMLESVTGGSLGEGPVNSQVCALIDNACAPLGRRIERAYSVVETRRTRTESYAELALQEHPAKVAARLGQAQTAKTYVDMGFTLEAVNQVMGLGFEVEAPEPTPEPPEPDSAVEMLADAAKNFRALCAKRLLPASPPDAAVRKDAGGVDALHTSGGQHLTITVKAEGTTAQTSPDPAKPGTAQAPAAGDVLSLGARKPRDKARVAKWEQYQKVRKPFETRILKAVTAVFKEATSKALADLAERATAPASEFDAALSDAMPAKALGLPECKGLRSEGKALSFATFTVNVFADNLTAALIPIIADAYAAGTAEAAAELRAMGIADKTPPEVGAFLKVRQNFIADAGKTTFAKLTQSLNAGYDAGETMPQLAGRVKQVMREATDTQATTIATTETHTAFNVARTRQQEAAGVEYKEWLTAGDSRVRESHLILDGIVMPADKPFILTGGVLLMHPCAEGGPAEEVINCRCIAGAVSVEEGAAKYEAQAFKEIL